MTRLICCSPQCDFVHDSIARVTPSTVETTDGRSITADVIICATGFDNSFKYPYPIIGRNGVVLNEKWSPHPRTYLAVCTDGFPNLFFSLGPNAGVGTTSVLGMMEHHIMYAVMATMKLQRERLKSIEVKLGAVDDFDAVIEVSLLSAYTNMNSYLSNTIHRRSILKRSVHLLL